MALRVLHVLSNFRWTERAEPAADAALAQQRLGVEVTFACGRNQEGAPPIDSVEFHVREKGLNLVTLELRKHFSPVSARRDLQHLRALIRDERFDVVHCHMPNALTLVCMAVATMPNRPLVVASCYDPDGYEWPLRFRLLCRRHTDGMIVIAPETVARVARQCGLTEQRIAVIEPGIDVDRFADRKDIGRLEDLSIAPGAFVIGTVTSVGRRRRLDLLLGALSQLAPRYPQLCLLLVGRGKLNQFVFRPAAEMGILDRVIIAGYCRDDRLVAAYHTMDLFAYTYPGTDKSCRAVREAMACGLPVVAVNVGFLPHLIEDGKTGFLSDLSVNGLAAALERALAARNHLAAFGAAAAAAARQRFSWKTHAERVLQFYEHLRTAGKLS